MEICLVKVLNGKPNRSENKITLDVHSLKGVPQVGDDLYFNSTFLGIIGLEKKGELYKMTVKVSPNSDFKWELVKELCLNQNYNVFPPGISKQTFMGLTQNKQIEYLNSLFESLGEGGIPRFLKDNLLFGKSINIGEKVDNYSKSKFGGLPNAPNGFAFPKDKNGQSALFVGQIEGEFSGQKGILYIFGNIQIYAEEYYSFDDFQVIFSEETNELMEIQLPEDLVGYGVFEELPISVSEIPNIPPHETSLWDDMEYGEMNWNNYCEIEDAVREFCPVENQPQLLGHPNQIQSCILYDTECKSTNKGWYNIEEKEFDQEELEKEIEPKAREWMLLFQLDTNHEYFKKLSKFEDEFCRFMDGNYYLMIKKTDFEKLDFEKTVIMYQST